MTDDEITICKHCTKPIEAGQAWHTLAEMHYDCYEQKFGAFVVREPMPKLAPAYQPPRFVGLKRARANGGHLVHLVSGDTGVALCGHFPKNDHGHNMRARGKWNFIRADYVSPSSRYDGCRKCDAKAAEMGTASPHSPGEPRPA
jgi:hypothetical protein